MWFEIKATADKIPEPAWHCENDQDCYNEKGANYVCKLPRGVCELSCPAGQIAVGGDCRGLACKQSSTSSYNCYINGRQCGGSKIPNPVNKSDFEKGICYPEFCSGLGEWTQISQPYSGFGCTNKDYFCAPVYTQDFNRLWVCSKASKPNIPCCRGFGFGHCDRGDCDESICDQFGGTYLIKDTQGGCRVTRNDHTAQCVPWEGTWFCNYPNNGGWTTSSENINFCGNCTAAEIDAGTCGTCFSGERQCPAGTYNKDLGRCVFEVNGQTGYISTWFLKF